MQIHSASHEIKTLEYQLVRIRMIEEAIAERYNQQKMRCPVHLSIGQEAIAVGVCNQITSHDYAISNHRAHAHYLAKGGDLKKMIAEIYGKQTGCCGGRGGSMHLIDLDVGFLGSTPIVGGSIPVGVGAAFASVLKKESRITVIFFGEGATEEGVFAESINFASLKKLPVLFVCENNLYSVYSPLVVRQSSERNITALAQAHGIHAAKGDGNNLQAVCSLTKDAVDNIRKGNGPSFLELSTYRFREHCGPSKDPYQPLNELSYWQERDPLKNIECDRSAIAKEIEEAFLFAEKSPYPALQDEKIYA